jgi:hypothetical protein
VKSTKIGAKIYKITEKGHLPMDFFCKTFNYSISPIYQQITTIKNGKKWKKWPNQDR